MFAYQLVISIFGFRKPTKNYKDFDPQLRFLVLVPAHNEEPVIAGIIHNLRHMEYPKELYDFYILADNCTDRTVDIARQMGANVIELHKDSEDAPTGKSVVLRKGLEILEGYQSRYDLVMFFDADNLIDPNMFLEVNSQYLSHEGNVDIIQCYLGCKNKTGIVALFYYVSFTIANRFFQCAKTRLGLNSGIGGTGYAISTQYLSERGGWTAMSLTEDFELQVEATCDGKRILWNHNVRVYDEKPTQVLPSLRQRTRWAQGLWYVTFQNTRKLFRALLAKRIPFKEFLSTFICMYSVTSYFVITLQVLLNLVISILRWTSLISDPLPSFLAGTWFFSTIPGILLFLYTFVILFYIADSMDNKCRVKLHLLPPLCLSVLLNTILIAWAQVAGLFRHKRQTNWVKTEHSINCLEESSRLLSGEVESNAKIRREPAERPA